MRKKKRRTIENKARRMKRVKRPVGMDSLEKSAVGWRNAALWLVRFFWPAGRWRLISTDLMARFICSELMRTLKFSAVRIMTLFICKSSAVCFLTIPLSLSLSRPLILLSHVECYRWGNHSLCIRTVSESNLKAKTMFYNITFKIKFCFVYFLTKVFDNVKSFSISSFWKSRKK